MVKIGKEKNETLIITNFRHRNPKVKNLCFKEGTSTQLSVSICAEVLLQCHGG